MAYKDGARTDGLHKSQMARHEERTRTRYSTVS